MAFQPYVPVETSPIVANLMSLCKVLGDIKTLATSLELRQYNGVCKDVILVRLTRAWSEYMSLVGAAVTEWDYFEQVLTLGKYTVLMSFQKTVFTDIINKLSASGMLTQQLLDELGSRVEQ